MTVDLRSDTVTCPSPEMRRAMAEASVGDAGYDEDPTVGALERRYCELVGKEAALFVPSGIMANQIALRTLTRPGDIVVAGGHQHLLQFERGASARNAGVQFHTVTDSQGVFEMEEVGSILADYEAIANPVSLVAFENTHMPSGGTPWNVDDVARLREVVGQTPIFCDGARLFNAVVATGASADALVEGVDMVTSCVSKGLGAPMGSVLAGSRRLIERAKKERLSLGGRLRQAGVVAAAGLIALSDPQIASLEIDHRYAKALAAGLEKCWGAQALAVTDVLTNIVIVRSGDPQSLVRTLSERGVLCNAIGPHAVRFVTHRDLSDDAIAEALCVCTQVAWR